MTRLVSIEIEGFKSIQRLSPPLELGPLNVMIGANGAGKSNLIGFFKLLHAAISGNFQSYSGREGGADRLLFFGAKRTQLINARLELRDESSSSSYAFSLARANGDALMFFNETLEQRVDGVALPRKERLGFGGRESSLWDEAELLSPPMPAARAIKSVLDRWQLFHFHDTSAEARVKQNCRVDDNRSLRSDAGNLAAMLYLFQERHPDTLREIRDTLRLAAPFFNDFALAPTALNPDFIKLEWREQGSTETFDAASFSDGTLRFLCLATLLLQPVLPELVIIDEPELGLHPYALALLGSMLRDASKRTQVLVSTQSPALLDEFEPAEVIVVDRVDGASQFRRLSAPDLEQWLDEYSLSELWNKNVLGGRPL